MEINMSRTEKRNPRTTNFSKESTVTMLNIINDENMNSVRAVGDAIEDCKIGRIADIPIFVDTGAEVISGSTRMKAGNSQKFVLNMITTCAMAKTGKVYENLMINLRPTNIKIKRRMVGIVAEICEVSDDEALHLLEENDFCIRRVFEKFGKVLNK